MTPLHFGNIIDMLKGEIYIEEDSMYEDYRIYVPNSLKILLNDKYAKNKFLRKEKGTIVFLDISGFTFLTEKLMMTGHEGSEELTYHINRYFDHLIKVITNYGGDIIKFGGDALLFHFDGDGSYIKAIEAVNKIIKIVGRQYDGVSTSAGKFTINIHCGMSYGEFWQCSFGSEDRQLEYLIFGEQVERAINLAEKVSANEVGIGIDLYPMFANIFEFERVMDEGFIKIKEIKKVKEFRNDSKRLDIEKGFSESMMKFIPEFVKEKIRKKDYIGEHRKVVTCFLSLESAFNILRRIGEKLIGEKVGDYFINIMSEIYNSILEILSNYEGTYLKTDISLKGEKIIYLFGAPVAHEDDGNRAIEATDKIIRSLREVNEGCKRRLGLESDLFIVKVGLNAGNAFWALVGNNTRKEWTVMGDSVNLAARIMNISKPWTISVIKEFANKLSEYEWEYIGEYLIKGKKDKFVIYKYNKRRIDVELREDAEEILIGREDEIAILDKCLDDISIGEKRLVSICGEAGMGKTILCINFIKRSSLKGIKVIKVTCQAFVKDEPYYVWKEVIREFFKLSNINDAGGIEEFLNRYIGEYRKWFPILNDLLEVFIEENEWTKSLLAKTRKAKLFEILCKLIKKLSDLNQLVLVFDDAHWMDNVSIEFIDYLFSLPINYRLMIIISHRKDFGIGTLKKLNCLVEIKLDEFTRDEAYRLMDYILGKDERLSNYKKIIYEKACGNPLFIRLLSESLVNQDVQGLKDVSLPDTISSMFLSIIDKMADEKKSFIKLAAIMGKTFDIRYMGKIFKKELQGVDINLILNKLCEEKWIIKDNDYQYSFKYPLMQEVAYESIPYSYKRFCHLAIADCYEKEAKDKYRIIGFLTYHYYHSSNATKAIEHLLISAEKSHKLYILNQSDKNFLDAANLIDKIRKRRYSDYFFEVFPAKDKLKEYEFNIFSGWGKVLSQMGRIKNAIDKFNKAIKNGYYLKRFNDVVRIKNKLAHCYFIVGRLKGAVKLINYSLTEAKKLNYYPGIAGCYNNLINICYKLKDSRKAMNFAKLAIKYALKASDYFLLADIYSNIGIIYWSVNKLNYSILYTKKALVVRKKIKDKYGIATCYNNIGVCYFNKKDYKEALDYYKRSLRLHKDLDDLYGIAWNYNNLGEIFFEMGKLETALKHFKKGKSIANEFGDKTLDIITSLFISAVLLRKGDYESGINLFNKIEESSIRFQLYEELMIVYYWIVRYFLIDNNIRLAFIYLKKLKKMLMKIDKSKFYYNLYYQRVVNLEKELNIKKEI